VTTAILAFDAGPDAGMGHQRRMEVLARCLAAKGTETALIAADERAKADVVVVDSYRFRADDSEHFEGNVLVALDDLRRDLAVDMVVDPSPGACADPHTAAAHVLAGPTYALIDPALASSPVAPIGADVHIVLVATGAGDDGGAGARVAAALAEALPQATVRLAVGPWATAAAPEGVDALETTKGLGPALAESDLVVTAGGVTMLEALALGRPTVAVVLAENQRQAAEGAAAAGAVALAEVRTAAGLAVELAGAPSSRRALSDAARHLIDGRGAERVAERVLSLV